MERTLTSLRDTRTVDVRSPVPHELEVQQAVLVWRVAREAEHWQRLDESRIAVNPDFQRQGVGQELMARLTSAAPWRCLSLWTKDGNSPAHRLTGSTADLGLPEPRTLGRRHTAKP